MRRVVVLALIAQGILASAAAAAPPAPATGTGTVVTTEVTSVRSAGPVVITEFHQTGTVTGTLSGTFVEDVRVIQHRDGRITFTGSATITGSAAGCGTGDIPVRLEGGGAGVGVSAHGRIQSVRSSANTAGAHVVLEFDQVGAVFTYSGTVRCG
jgi:hypothetical protein